MRIRFLFFLLFFCCTYLFNGFAAVDDVRISLNKKKITIGDPITFSLTVNSDKKTEILIPRLGEVNKDIFIIEYQPKVSLKGDRKETKDVYKITGFKPGVLVIPKLEIKHRLFGQNQWEIVLSPQDQVMVEAIVPGQAQYAQIKDIKKPWVGRSLLPWILIGLLILAGLAWYIIKKYFFSKQKVLTEIIRPADEIALEQLIQLKNKNLPESGRFKEYYSQISWIIRHYLENRFKICAPEMTTEEFMNMAANSVVLTGKQKNSLKEFLCACDMVKFAKYLPDPEECAVIYESAVKFVHETKLDKQN